MSLNLSTSKTVTHHLVSTSSLLQYARKNRFYFCDVILQASNLSLSANKMVLSGCSKYFERLFQHDLRNKNKNFVDLPDIEGEVLTLLVDSAYSGQISLNSENVSEVVDAADQLELNEIKKFCFEFLTECLTTTNCFAVLTIANRYRNLSLKDQVYRYISSNYQTVTNTKLFQTVSYNELFPLIYQLKQRFYVNEENLCSSIITWVKYDEEARKGRTTTLMKFVDAKQLSYWFLKDLLVEELVQSNPYCLNFFNERYQALCKKGTKILSFGGEFTPTKVAVILSLDNQVNPTYPNLPIPILLHRSLKWQNSVYVIGGQANGCPSQKVFQLDLNQTESMWKEVVPLNGMKLDIGGAVFNDCLVVSGGFKLTASEAYDVTQNKWNYISPLQQKKYGNEFVVCSRYLYSLGGYDGCNYLPSVERLDVSNAFTCSWEFVASMQTERSWFAAACCNNVIYAIGGKDKYSKRLKSVEKYVADRWVYVSEMNVERYGHCACVLQGKIFVIGGRNSANEPVKEIECYDVSVDEWKVFGCTEDKLVDNAIVVV